jgi:signal recognition particle GTPase
MTSKAKISLEEYLEEVARFCENEYGNRFRGQFQDMKGTSELAMLAAPTDAELTELRRAVAIMTAAEKQNAETLSDEQVARIAEDARVDPANLAIFINGYALTCKRVS